MILLLFVSGLAIFLYAMRSLEAGIRILSGERLNRWIVVRTNTPLSSAGCGVVVTAILQSSSMVSLVVLAFVSASIMPLYNGIGVVLGANLGTTFTGWLVTVIGFKMNLQSLVIPLLGLGAVCNLGYLHNDRLAGFGRTMFAFGLLIFGLDIMKESVAGLSETFDLSALHDMPSLAFLGAGIFLAAVMQSSSAAMIIALSMLNSDMVQLQDAAALVIGADLGTTSTTVLGSLGESMVKKQLAFAHVFFNVLVDGAAFLFFLPALPWFLQVFSIQDSMFGLVAFHSSFNLVGLIIFLPLLKYYTRWIERILPLNEVARGNYFDVPVEVADAAIDSLAKAHRHLAGDAVRLSWQGLEVNPSDIDLGQVPDGFEANQATENSYQRNYEILKAFEGDLIQYANRLRHTKLAADQEQKIAMLVESARSLVYASKTLKDVRLDYVQLRQSVGDNLAQELFNLHFAYLVRFYKELLPLFFKEVSKEKFEEFAAEHRPDYSDELIHTLVDRNNLHHRQANDLITKNLADDGEQIPRVSTWFNLNHELQHYGRQMLTAAAVTASPDVAK